MRPLARTEDLLLQEVDAELVIYDQQRHIAHCLRPIAVCVWQHCNGHNTVEDLATLLEQAWGRPAEEAVDMQCVVRCILDELDCVHLLADVPHATGLPTVSRREVLKTATAAGGLVMAALFPVITSLVAPSPAMAVSPAGAGGGSEITNG
jgi:hypothetical protein